MGFWQKIRGKDELKPSTLRQRVRELHEDGLTTGEIAEELTVDVKRVTNILDYQQRREKKDNPISSFFESYKAFKEFENGIKDEVREELDEKEDSSFGDALTKILPQLLGGNNVRNGSTDRRAETVPASPDGKPGPDKPTTPTNRRKPRKA